MNVEHSGELPQHPETRPDRDVSPRREQHLQKYVSEFDFRYNTREKLGVNDAGHADKALKGITGKRLTYRRI